MQSPLAWFTENYVLAALSVASLQTIAPDFTSVTLPPGAILDEQDEPAADVYFPLSGVVSMVILMDDGTQVQGAIVGREGAIGVAPWGGNWAAPWRYVVQAPTRAVTMPAPAFARHMEALTDLRRVVEMYGAILFAFVGQSIACNRLHTTTQRLARHLLAFRDRVDDDALPLTHEFLAELLGVGRPTLTTAAVRLRRIGAIEYHRGSVVVQDRALLERNACECYERIRRRFALLRPSDA